MMLNFRKIQMLPAREQVASILRSAILTDEIKKGHSLTLDSVSEMVGMSRTPVREAFQILASEGLLELRQNRCAIVKGVSIDAIKDHYEMRILLETEAVRRACARMNEQVLNALKEVCAQGEEARKAGDTHAFNMANQAFHLVFWEAAQSEKLKSFLSLLWNGLSMNHRARAQDYANASQHEHKEMLNSIIAKDYESACELMHKHITRSMNSTLMNYDAQEG